MVFPKLSNVYGIKWTGFKWIIFVGSLRDQIDDLSWKSDASVSLIEHHDLAFDRTYHLFSWNHRTGFINIKIRRSDHTIETKEKLWYFALVEKHNSWKLSYSDFTDTKGLYTRVSGLIDTNKKANIYTRKKYFGTVGLYERKISVRSRHEEILPWKPFSGLLLQAQRLVCWTDWDSQRTAKKWIFQLAYIPIFKKGVYSARYTRGFSSKLGARPRRWLH